MILNKNKILEKIENKELIIRPLLEVEQIGEVSLDLRLGYDFLVSIQGRRPFINASLNGDTENSQVNDFFQDTRRRIGETFILHPNQTVLATTLEYIKLPSNVIMNIGIRSSYARLGIYLNTTVQPGYCGCVSLELINTSKTPVNLCVGAPLIQAQFQQLEEKQNYFSKPRKYICQVRPQLSGINTDPELRILNRIWESTNHFD
ncbi:dCTP deaminase [Marinifilum flexuosum]|uniref:dCTP deaminase n=1 Tax=Marinifilum flexuosum TaxID=1117708 RepID=UPI00248FE9C4|nr:dCTP deaminase [Marinifilum flexuosum]